MEDAGVGAFVEHVHALEAEVALVDLLECLAEGEDGVEARHLQATDRLGGGAGAMMGVVEEGAEATRGGEGENGIDQFRRIPFVDNDDIEAVELLSEIGPDVPEEAHHRLRVECVELRERTLARLALQKEIVDRPVVLALEADDGVALPGERAKQSAQEVGVAVVPVRAK